MARGFSDPAHPLKHAVMVAIDNVAVGQGGGAWNQSKPSVLLKETIGDTIKENDLEMPTAKRPKKSTQYLCTGYDLYTVKEPCVM